MAPSSVVTGLEPSSSNFSSKTFAKVDLPDPGNPVTSMLNPRFSKGGYDLRSSLITSGYENHAGISAPDCNLFRSSVPERFMTCAFSGNSSLVMYLSELPS